MITKKERRFVAQILDNMTHDLDEACINIDYFSKNQSRTMEDLSEALQNALMVFDK